MFALRWLAATRLRLAVTGLLGLVLVACLSPGLADFARERSVSPSTNLLLMLAWASGVLISAYLLGILATDLIVQGHWRERVYVPPERYSPELTEHFLTTPFRPHRLLLGLLVVGIIASFVTGLNALTVIEARHANAGKDTLSQSERGGFFSTREIAYAHRRTVLRSDNSESKHKLIVELLAAGVEEEVRDALGLLDLTWRDRDQEHSLRVAALRAITERSSLLVSGIRSWTKHGVSDHWEGDVLRTLHRELGPGLKRLLQGEDHALAAQGAYALGAMRHPKTIEYLLTITQDRISAPDALWRAAVTGLGLRADLEALSPLEALTEQVNTQLDFEVLSWAIGEIMRLSPPRDSETPEAFAAVIARFGPMLKTGPTHQRCLSAIVLLKSGDISTGPPLMAAFEDSSNAELSCDTVTINAGARAPRLVLTGQPYRYWLIRALANIAVGNEELLEWVERHAGDKRYSQTEREWLSQLKGHITGS